MNRKFFVVFSLIVVLLLGACTPQTTTIPNGEEAFFSKVLFGELTLKDVTIYADGGDVTQSPAGDFEGTEFMVVSGNQTLTEYDPISENAEKILLADGEEFAAENILIEGILFQNVTLAAVGDVTLEVDGTLSGAEFLTIYGVVAAVEAEAQLSDIDEFPHGLIVDFDVEAIETRKDEILDSEGFLAEVDQDAQYVFDVTIIPEFLPEFAERCIHVFDETGADVGNMTLSEFIDGEYPMAVTWIDEGQAACTEEVTFEDAVVEEQFPSGIVYWQIPANTGFQNTYDQLPYNEFDLRDAELFEAFVATFGDNCVHAFRSNGTDAGNMTVSQVQEEGHPLFVTWPDNNSPSDRCEAVLE